MNQEKRDWSELPLCDLTLDELILSLREDVEAHGYPDRIWTTKLLIVSKREPSLKGDERVDAARSVSA